MNAKQELDKILRSLAPNQVICAELFFDETPWDYEGSTTKNFVLREHHSHDEFEEFLNNLDFDYDSGYGTQMLSGIVWLESGIWLERGEYDGSEWWSVRHYPEIPIHLR